MTVEALERHPGLADYPQAAWYEMARGIFEGSGNVLSVVSDAPYSPMGHNYGVVITNPNGLTTIHQPSYGLASHKLRLVQLFVGERDEDALAEVEKMPLYDPADEGTFEGAERRHDHLMYALRECAHLTIRHERLDLTKGSVIIGGWLRSVPVPREIVF